MRHHDDVNDTQGHTVHTTLGQGFDREYVLAHGFPATRETTVTAPTIASGVKQYIIQTFRAPEVGDTVFITITGPEGLQRICLPPKVTNAIASQRDALTAKNRRAAGKARAARDKAAGVVPGFMRVPSGNVRRAVTATKKKGGAR